MYVTDQKADTQVNCIVASLFIIISYIYHYPHFMKKKIYLEYYQMNQIYPKKFWFCFIPKYSSMQLGKM